MANERTVYAWREAMVGFYWRKVNPQLVGEELARIAKAGKLTPEAVIDRARDEGSVLHQALGRVIRKVERQRELHGAAVSERVL